jgi:hypothetical protein
VIRPVLPGPNVLHGPKNVGSQASSLARAENQARQLLGWGGRSTSVDFFPRPAADRADVEIPLRAGADRGLIGKIRYATGPLLYGLRHAGWFDVLHLYFGESLFSFARRFPALEMLDLPAWRLAGKRLFMTFQGCDARLKTESARAPVSACHARECDYAPCNAALDGRRRGMIEKVRRHCDRVFCLNPDLLSFVPGAEFLPYASVGSDLLEADSRAHGPAEGLPTVVHAPTNRSIKGTRHVVAASEALQRRLPHRLVLVEGLSRSECLAALESADVLIDQVLVGWYGGLAVEAMALGVPVVCRIDEMQRSLIPAAMGAELPIVSGDPATLEQVLGELLTDPDRRWRLGQSGRRYVARWHHPVRIAARMLELYQDPRARFWDGYDPERGLSPGPSA